MIDGLFSYTWVLLFYVFPRIFLECIFESLIIFHPIFHVKNLDLSFDVSYKIKGYCLGSFSYLCSCFKEYVNFDERSTAFIHNNKYIYFPLQIFCLFENCKHFDFFFIIEGNLDVIRRGVLLFRCILIWR